MSIMRYFARNSLLRLVFFGCSVLAVFFVTPHIMRCLGQETYGVWVLITGLQAYYLLLDFGAYNALSKKSSAALALLDSEALSSLYSTGLCITACGYCIVLGIGAALSLFSSLPADSSVAHADFALCMMLMSAVIGFTVMSRASFGMLAGAARWKLLASLAMGRTLISTVGVLFFLQENLSPSENLLRMAYVSAAAFMAEHMGIIIAVRLVAGVSFRRKSISPARAGELLRFGMPLQLAGIGNLLKNNTQIYIAASVLGLAEVTLLSLSRQFVNYMQDVMLSAFGILNPYFSRLHAEGNIEECRLSLLTALRLSYTAACTIGLGVIFYGGQFFAWWLGPQFSEAEKTLTPLACAAILSCGGIPASDCLVGMGKHTIFGFLGIAQGLCITLASFPIAWGFGLPGICWLLFIVTAAVSFGIVPMLLSKATDAPLWAYYSVITKVIALQTVAQTGFFFCARGFIQPDIIIIALAGLGQTLVAAGAFLGHMYIAGLWNKQRV